MTPAAVPITAPMTTRRRLMPMRRHSSSDTGWPVMVWPKSPRTAPESQCPYRSRSGLSRFSMAAVWAMTSLDTGGLRPSRLSSGLKDHDVNANVRKEASASSTRALSSRPARNRVMPRPPHTAFAQGRRSTNAGPEAGLRARRVPLANPTRPRGGARRPRCEVGHRSQHEPPMVAPAPFGRRPLRLTRIA